MHTPQLVDDPALALALAAALVLLRLPVVLLVPFTLLIDELCEALEEVEEVPVVAPESFVLRRSHDVSVVDEQRAWGIVPDKLGLEVRERVESVLGREEGEEVKALFSR